MSPTFFERIGGVEVTCRGRGRSHGHCGLHRNLDVVKETVNTLSLSHFVNGHEDVPAPALHLSGVVSE